MVMYQFVWSVVHNSSNTFPQVAISIQDISMNVHRVQAADFRVQPINLRAWSRLPVNFNL